MVSIGWYLGCPKGQLGGAGSYKLFIDPWNNVYFLGFGSIIGALKLNE